MTIEAVRTPPAARPPGRSATRGGPDRWTVALFSLALMLILLTLVTQEFLAEEAGKKPPRFTLVRKVYSTRVIETIISPGPSGGPSVTQSVASTGSATPIVSTRTS